MASLSGIGLLAGLRADERKHLEEGCRWHTYRRDETILERDSENRDVFFLASGAVRIMNYSLSGRPVAYATLAAGEYFGEMAAIDNAPRSATVVADERCDVAALSQQRFIALMEAHPQIALAVMRRLAGIVRSCDERIMDLATLGAMQRVIVDLCRMSRPDPITPGSWLIYPCPAQREIAGRASTTRETVARVFSQLQESAQIRRKGRTLYLANKAALETLAKRLAPGSG
jgi:CRP/FNR family cyclic AMP-dependent transcriptional regulator